MGDCTGTSKKPSKKVRSGRDGSNSANEMSILRKMDVDFPNGQILPTPHLKIFTLSELRSATRNFGRDTILGGGGFGTVFKGWLDEKTLAPAKPDSGMVTAVEKFYHHESTYGVLEWQSAVDFLGGLSHPNLVKLLGYCLDEKTLLLVYEFMAEGSLEKHLFKKVSRPLPWSTRLKILIGAARGLAFLHTSDKKVIKRDFKTSNILLDTNYHAKLSDFGLEKEGLAPRFERHGRVMGTRGYAAPEDVATGHLYDDKTDDVYGFGGVLLEMLSGQRAPFNRWATGQRNLKELVDLTGLRALDTSRPSGQQNLVEGVMDKRLEGQYPPEAALKAAQLSLKCLDNDPRSRPSMEEVVDALEQIEAIK